MIDKGRPLAAAAAAAGMGVGRAMGIGRPIVYRRFMYPAARPWLVRRPIQRALIRRRFRLAYTACLSTMSTSAFIMDAAGNVRVATEADILPQQLQPVALQEPIELTVVGQDGRAVVVYATEQCAQSGMLLLSTPSGQLEQAPVAVPVAAPAAITGAAMMGVPQQAAVPVAAPVAAAPSAPPLPMATTAHAAAPAAPAATGSSNKIARIQELGQMLAAGVITQQEHDTQRAAIIASV